MGKPKAPPAPDYAALATQQGTESRDTAGFNSNLNRVNQYGPDGSSTWATRPGADPRNPRAGDWSQTISYSPDQQRLYDSQNRISQQFANTAEAGLGRVGNSMGQSFNPQGLPGLQTVNAGGAQPVRGVNAYGLPNTNMDPGHVQGSLDRSNLPGLDYGTAEARQRVEAAMRQRIEPQLAEQQHSVESQLLNSGLEKGSQAWNSEMDRLGRQRNDANAQITAAGGAEESRLSDLQRAQRAQLFGETTTAGNFANTASGQDFGQRLGAAGFENQAAGQDFQQRLQSGNFANQSAYQNILAQLNAAGQNNQTRGQGWQEQLQQRQLPLNETNALRTGAQVQTPQFGSYYTGGNAQSAPYMDAGLAQGAYDQNTYNQNQGGYNALLGGLTNLGSSWMRYSDARLKDDVETIGQHPSGVRRVSWRWKGRVERSTGVIAQELQAIRPDAVFVGPGGFLRVDYSRIGGA